MSQPTSRTSAPRTQLLVVDDEDNLRRGLRLHLELEGFRVRAAADLAQARAALADRPADLLVLDASLPDGDGFDFAAELRRDGDLTPILLLTVRASSAHRVAGLDAGADDYLTKPFAMAELLARIRALLRRRRWDAAADASSQVPAVVHVGAAEVDFSAQLVRRGRDERELTKLEADLVRYFLANLGRVLSRQELLAEVWGLPNYPNTRTVDNFVLRLRKIFEDDPGRPLLFVSVRGAGYKYLPGDS